jgi:hypothetical protein
LTPLGVAISYPYWKETNTQAVAGSDEQGRPMVLAQREKTLAFAWSAFGVADPFGAVEFSLSLPESPIRRLTLDVPQDLSLEIRGGIVEEIASDRSQDDAVANFAPADPGMRRWRVEAAASGTVTLRIAPRAERTESRLVAMQQSSVYDLRPEGLSLAEELRLFVRGTPAQGALGANSRGASGDGGAIERPPRHIRILDR